MASHPEALVNPGTFRTSPGGVTSEITGPARPPVVGPKPVFQVVREAFDLLDQRESAARASGDEELAGQYRQRRQEFSAALDKNAREQARQQVGRQAAQARELALDRTRDEAAIRKQTLADPATQKLLAASRRAALLSQVMKGVPGAIQRTIIAPKPPAASPSIAQQRLELSRRTEQRQIEAGEASAERRDETAEARTPEARFDSQVGLIERELGRKLTRGQRLRLLKNPDIIEEFAAEADKQPFTQTPTDSGELEVATRDQIQDAAQRVGITGAIDTVEEAEKLEAELEKEGLRVQ